MPIDQLIFIALNSYAVALHRDTGEIVWSSERLKFGYAMTMMLDGDRLIVSSSGYIYCLDPGTGKTLWFNPLKGYGRAAPTAIASARGQAADALLVGQANAAAG